MKMTLGQLVEGALSEADQQLKLASAADVHLPFGDSAIKIAMDDMAEGATDEEKKKKMKAMRMADEDDDEDEDEDEEEEKTSALEDAAYAQELVEALGHIQVMFPKLASEMPTFKGQHNVGDTTKDSPTKPKTVDAATASHGGGGSEAVDGGSSTGIATNSEDFKSPDWTANPEAGRGAIRTSGPHPSEQPAKTAADKKKKKFTEQDKLRGIGSALLDPTGGLIGGALMGGEGNRLRGAGTQYAHQTGTTLGGALAGGVGGSALGTGIGALAGNARFGGLAGGMAGSSLGALAGGIRGGMTGARANRLRQEAAAARASQEGEKQSSLHEALAHQALLLKAAGAKFAQDPSSPQPTNLPTSSDPGKMDYTPGGTSAIPDNTGMINMTKRQAKTQYVKGDAAKLLREPAFDASTDKGLQDNLAMGLETAKVAASTPITHDEKFQGRLGAGILGTQGAFLGGGLGAMASEALGKHPGIGAGVGAGLGALAGGVGGRALGRYGARKEKELDEARAEMAAQKMIEAQQAAKTSGIKVAAQRALLTKVAAGRLGTEKQAAFHRALERHRRVKIASHLRRRAG